MKKISQWGRRNPWTTRLIIAVCMTVLSLMVMTLGYQLNDAGIDIPKWVYYSILGIFLGTFICYPYYDRYRKFTASSFYIRRKLCDGILAFSSLGLVLYMSDHPGNLFRYLSNAKAATPVENRIRNNDLPKPKNLVEFYKSLKDENNKLLKWKERRKLLKEQVRSIRHDEGMSNGAKVLLTILCVLVALGLIGLVLALACDLSCNGSAGAAIVVGIGGLALVIFLAVIAIRAINGSKRRKKTQTAPSGGS